MLNIMILIVHYKFRYFFEYIFRKILKGLTLQKDRRVFILRRREYITFVTARAFDTCPPTYSILDDFPFAMSVLCPRYAKDLSFHALSHTLIFSILLVNIKH